MRTWRKKPVGKRTAVAEETKCETYLCMYKTKVKGPQKKRLLEQRRRCNSEVIFMTDVTCP